MTNPRVLLAFIGLFGLTSNGQRLADNLLALLAFIGLFCGALFIAGCIAKAAARRERAEQEAHRLRFVAGRVREETACTMAQEIMRHVNYPQYDPPVQPPQPRALAAAAGGLWHDEQGQDVAEYAVMLAVILVLVIGTIRLVGGSANNVFSSVGSSLSQ